MTDTLSAPLVIKCPSMSPLKRSTRVSARTSSRPMSFALGPVRVSKNSPDPKSSTFKPLITKSLFPARLKSIISVFMAETLSRKVISAGNDKTSRNAAGRLWRSFAIALLKTLYPEVISKLSICSFESFSKEVFT